MPKVKNENVAGRPVRVIDSLVDFDSDGIATVSDEQAEVLAQIPGYEILEAKPEAKKADKKAAGSAAPDKE
jgi:hypothetical protein